MEKETNVSKKQLDEIAWAYAMFTWTELKAKLEGHTGSAEIWNAQMSGFVFALPIFNVMLDFSEDCDFGYSWFGERISLWSNEFSLNNHKYKITDFQSDYLDLVKQAKENGK